MPVEELPARHEAGKTYFGICRGMGVDDGSIRSRVVAARARRVAGRDRAEPGTVCEKPQG
ncbi:hypothetical protein [Allonocardiopsis opalescens]|uniref:Uncharacterized protein n=1 Tax=Allonocardiopsis opalescens TaxID=1144618 RepID=A0A2T0Q056_9ACTN|nr:hypothetical protein [Allonocardiopsis opalescens]PRX97170.1 hypothetical protein CLV72_106206 [Allonocardiopsis opalescens]